MLVEPALLEKIVSALSWAAASGGVPTAYGVTPASGPTAAYGPTALASATSGSATASAVGWITFALLVGFAVLGVPLVAALLRRGLPARLRERPAAKPMRFGASQKVSRSPRHAVLLHRSLIVCLFLALVVFLLVPGVLAIRTLGVSTIRVGLALVLPTLLVTLHARRRGQGV